MIVEMVQQEVYQDQVTAEETTVEYLDLHELIHMMVEFLEVQEGHQVDLVQTVHQEQEVQAVEVEQLKLVVVLLMVQTVEMEK